MDRDELHELAFFNASEEEYLEELQLFNLSSAEFLEDLKAERHGNQEETFKVMRRNK